MAAGLLFAFAVCLLALSDAKNPQHPPLLKELSALSLMAGGVRWPDGPEAQAVPITGDDQLSWSVGKAAHIC